MSTLTIVLLVIALVLTAAFVALYFFTKRMEKKQDAQREQMDAMAQSMSMLIIDKKRMRLKDSGLPVTLWEQWSTRDAGRYHKGECVKKWESFHGGGASPVTASRPLPLLIGCLDC